MQELQKSLSFFEAPFPPSLSFHEKRSFLCFLFRSLNPQTFFCLCKVFNELPLFKSAKDNVNICCTQAFEHELLSRLVLGAAFMFLLVPPSPKKGRREGKRILIKWSEKRKRETFFFISNQNLIFTLHWLGPFKFSANGEVRGIFTVFHRTPNNLIYVYYTFSRAKELE